MIIIAAIIVAGLLYIRSEEQWLSVAAFSIFIAILVFLLIKCGV